MPGPDVDAVAAERPLAGHVFYFAGEFAYCPPRMQPARPPAMVRALGAEVADALGPGVTRCVVGSKRRKGKAADEKAAQRLAGGGALEILQERAFVGLLAEHAPGPGEPVDEPGLLRALLAEADRGRLTRALTMLQDEGFQLFHERTDGHLAGVVRSQTTPDQVYSCRLAHDGRFLCTDGDLAECMGLRGEVCKHLLVLVIGLVRKGLLDPRTARDWLLPHPPPEQTRVLPLDAAVMGAPLLRVRGAALGELDWRPTEILPEDFLL